MPSTAETDAPRPKGSRRLYVKWTLVAVPVAIAALVLSACSSSKSSTSTGGSSAASGASGASSASGPPVTVTIGVAATQDSIFEWRELGAQVIRFSTARQ